MSALLPLLAQCAVLLVCGSTVLLALGCGAVLLCKSPVHRQRISELTIAGVLVWMENFLKVKIQSTDLIILQISETLKKEDYGGC